MRDPQNLSQGLNNVGKPQANLQLNAHMKGSGDLTQPSHFLGLLDKQPGRDERGWAMKFVARATREFQGDGCHEGLYREIQFSIA